MRESPTYVLRIPFRLGPGYFFDEGDFTVDGFHAELQVRDGWHILLVRGIPTEEAAREFLMRVCPALQWVAIETTRGIRVECELQELFVRDEPAPSGSLLEGAHGVANEGRPVIFPR